MGNTKIKIDGMESWKPQLYPNDKSDTPDIRERIEDPNDYCYSDKLDGGRIGLICSYPGQSRDLKDIPSRHIQEMVTKFNDTTLHEGVIEAEFYSPEMTFGEIMHFFRTADVTSEKTVKKYTALWKRTKGGTVEILKGKEYPVGQLVGEDLKKSIGWKYPGRDVEWLTTWHDSLKMYVFDHYKGEGDTRTKWERYEELEDMFNDHDIADEAILIKQVKFDHIDRVYQAFDQVVLNGGEGLMISRLDSKYKTGRFTIKSGQAFKLKDSSRIYEGVVTEVLEGTVVKDGVEKTVNDFGRSKTSKLKEDRIPSGMAANFKTVMDDHNVIKVSLIGYTHEDRKELLLHPEVIVGKRISFKGMKPVTNRAEAVPRHCHFTRGDIIG